MSAMRNFHGKRVLVTGGAKGIGRETVRLFAQNGARVAMTGRDTGALRRQAEQFGREGLEVLALAGDVTSLEECRAAIQATEERFGGLDVLVNNAGMSMRGMFEQTSLELFRTVMDINFTGAVSMTRLALPQLLQSKGSVVFVSSLSGLHGLPGIAPYSAAKMALTGFSQALRCELSPRGVHVGILYVSFTENDSDKTIYDAEGNRIQLQRARNGSTQLDVAHAVVQMVRHRRRSVIMTPLGKLAALAYTLLPGLSERLITRFATRSALYGNTAKGGST